MVQVGKEERPVKNPNFRDIMNLWLEDFNASRRDIQIRYEDFTKGYTCVRVGERNSDKTECCAHFYTVEINKAAGNCIEIGGAFIPAEDPSLFDRLVARIEKKAKQ